MLATLFDITVFVFLYYCFLIPFIKTKSHSIQTITLIFSVYMLCVLIITLTPILTSLPFIFAPPFSRMLNTTPFIDVLEKNDDAVMQIFLNILLTIPFGYLFPLFFKPNQRSFKWTLLATFSLTVAIESTQWLLANGRITDVTDLITNTLGGVVGYAIYKATRQIVLVYKRQQKKSLMC